MRRLAYFFSLLAVSLAFPSVANQTTILSCHSDDLTHVSLYDVYQDVEGSTARYFLIERTPTPPYERQEALSSPPLLSGNTVEIREEGARGHAYVHPLPNQRYWFIDIALGGIVANQPSSYLCRVPQDPS